MTNIIRKLFDSVHAHPFDYALQAYWIPYLIWFQFLESHVTKHFHVVYSELDRLIPFCEYFVIPYFIWFGFVAFGFIYVFRQSAFEYRRLCLFLFTGMTVFLFISTVYPNGAFLRPSIEADNVFSRLVLWLYRTDTATNLFPSIHVFNSIGVAIAVSRVCPPHHHALVRRVTIVIAALIVMSTMFIKQHSVFDVVTAILMAAVLYCLVYVRSFHPADYIPDRLRRSSTENS